MQFISLLR